MAYTYAGYQTSLAELMGTSTTDVDFLAVLPNAIDYAELRIYRDLDLLNTRQTQTAGSATIGTRLMPLPTGIVVTEMVNVISPGSTAPAAGTRNVLTIVSRETMNSLYPNEGIANAGLPRFFAMQDQSDILLGPPPDQAYMVEVTGTYRPTPLSATNTTTILTTNYPDLFLSASMVFASGYMKNYSASSDDPQQPVNWESQYKTQLKSALIEEFRKKFQGSSWTPEMASPTADKQRG